MIASSGSSRLGEQSIIEKSVVGGSSKEKIALIDVDGVIMSNSSNTTGNDMVQQIIKKLELVQNDSSYKAVILRINTPGGTVFDSDKIAKEIIKTKTAGKKVIALMEASATSGGYYISAPTDKIIASDVTLTGSIGVVSQVIKLDGLYEKLGIDVINITNSKGDVKTFEHLDDPNSKDRKVFQEVLDDNFDAFVNMVDENRALTKDQVLALADGSIYSGKKALEIGLVDELGGIDEAVASAKELADLASPEIVELNDSVDLFSELLGSSFVKSLGLVSNLSNKLKADPGVYSWYIVAP